MELIWSKDRQYIKTQMGKTIFMTCSFTFRIFLSTQKLIHIYNQLCQSQNLQN